MLLVVHSIRFHHLAPKNHGAVIHSLLTFSRTYNKDCQLLSARYEALLFMTGGTLGTVHISSIINIMQEGSLLCCRCRWKHRRMAQPPRQTRVCQHSKHCPLILSALALGDSVGNLKAFRRFPMHIRPAYVNPCVFFWCRSKPCSGLCKQQMCRPPVYFLDARSS